MPENNEKELITYTNLSFDEDKLFYVFKLQELLLEVCELYFKDEQITAQNLFQKVNEHKAAIISAIHQAFEVCRVFNKGSEEIEYQYLDYINFGDKSNFLTTLWIGYNKAINTLVKKNNNLNAKLKTAFANGQLTGIYNVLPSMSSAVRKSFERKYSNTPDLILLGGCFYAIQLAWDCILFAIEEEKKKDGWKASQIFPTQNQIILDINDILWWVKSYRQRQNKKPHRKELQRRDDVYKIYFQLIEGDYERSNNDNNLIMEIKKRYKNSYKKDLPVKDSTLKDWLINFKSRYWDDKTSS